MIRDQIRNELPHLRRYARSIARDPDDAEDLVQECLVRALSRESGFRPGSHPRRWLFTILRNISIDRHRRRARRGIHVPLADWQAPLRRPPAQEDRLALLELGRRMDELRPCDREVLRLSVFDGLSHREIAERMDIAVGTVKSRLSRSREALHDG